MNRSVTLLLFLIISACSGKKTIEKESTIRTIINSLSADTTQPIIICNINPNDCINCLYAFSEFERTWKQGDNTKILVMNVRREIEQQELIRTTRTISLKSRPGYYVLWSENIFRMIQKENDVAGNLSHISLYDYGGDTIIHQRIVKDITDVNEFSRYMRSQHAKAN